MSRNIVISYETSSVNTAWFRSVLFFRSGTGRGGLHRDTTKTDGTRPVVVRTRTDIHVSDSKQTVYVIVSPGTCGKTVRFRDETYLIGWSSWASRSPRRRRTRPGPRRKVRSSSLDAWSILGGNTAERNAKKTGRDGGRWRTVGKRARTGPDKSTKNETL